MQSSADECVNEILPRDAITADDVQKLRMSVFWKGVVTERDAEMAFTLNDKFGHQADPSWPPFFIEALTSYIVTSAPR